MLLAVLLAVGAGVACQPIARTPPPPPPDAGVVWHSVPAADGTSIRLGVLDSSAPASSTRPVILLLHNSSGIAKAFVDYAKLHQSHGFDVVLACWFQSTSDVPCPGPTLKGVTDAALVDLKTITGAVRKMFAGRRLLVEGHSLGASAALLLASLGQHDLYAGAAGPYHGFLAGDVDVTTRAATIAAPVLLLHGRADTFVPFSNATDMEAAIRATGRSVETMYIQGGTHNLDLSTVAARVEQFADATSLRVAPVSATLTDTPSTTGATAQLTVVNDGPNLSHVLSTIVAGTAASSFPVTNDTCAGQRLAPSQSCTLDVGYVNDTGTGTHTATLLVGASGREKVQVTLSGTGLP